MAHSATMNTWPSDKINGTASFSLNLNLDCSRTVKCQVWDGTGIYFRNK